MPANSEIKALRRKIEGLEKRIVVLEKKKGISPPSIRVGKPRWVEELVKTLETAVEDIGSIVLFSYASKGSHMSIGDSIEKIMEFEPDEIVTLLKGLGNPERIKILKILSRDLNGRYVQELMEETQLSEGNLHYHIRWLSKSQLIIQELARGKYKATQLGVAAVSLIGILVYSIKVPAQSHERKHE